MDFLFSPIGWVELPGSAYPAPGGTGDLPVKTKTFSDYRQEEILATETVDEQIGFEWKGEFKKREGVNDPQNCPCIFNLTY